MMASSLADGGAVAASYKKREGSLMMAKDRRSVMWRPASGGDALDVKVADIISMSSFFLPF